MTQRNSDTGRIAVIQSGWYRDIVDRGRDSLVAELAELGVAQEMPLAKTPSSQRKIR